MPLPKGYTLDAPSPAQPGGVKLPAGYTLDAPTAQPEGFASSFADQTYRPVVNLVKDYGQHVQEHPNWGYAAGIPALAQTVSDIGNSLIDSTTDAGRKTIAALKAGDYASAAQQAPGVIPIIGPESVKAGEQIAAGDYAGAAGTLAGLTVAAKTPEIVQGVPGVAKAAGENVVAGSQKLAANPTVRAVAPAVGKMAVKAGVKGTLGALGLHLGGISGAIIGNSIADGIMDGLGKLFPTEAEETAAETTPVKPTSTQISSEPEVSPKISVRSATSADNTTPNTNIQLQTNVGKSFRTADTLDPKTQAAIAEGARNGKIMALPAQQKQALVNAVKAGDSATVNQVLGVPQHSAVDGVLQAVQNKLAVMGDFARTHRIDIGALDTPEKQQIFAQAAHAHGVANNMPVPVKGYRGISPSTLALLQDTVKGGGQ